MFFISPEISVKSKAMNYEIISNMYSMLIAIFFMVQTKSPTALPGVISYVGAFLIITLIILYKKRAGGYLTEIESQKMNLIESESKLHKMAFYDSLTGLPNKELFINRLEQNISLAKRNGKLIGTMFIDLDSFKSVNDTMSMKLQHTEAIALIVKEIVK